MIGTRGVSWRTRGYAVAAGVLVGAIYSVSPTTICFLLLLPVLFAWAGRDLGLRERRWVLGLLAVGVVARLLALSGFFLITDHFTERFGVLVGDERFILNQSQWMVNLARGYRLDALNYSDRFGTYGRSGLQNVLAYWQLWFGAAPYGAHLLSVAMWLSAAVALHRAARHAFGPLAALGGFAIVLFMPTLFVWSISALKEPAYFLLTAMTLAGAMRLVRGPRARTRLRAALLVAGAVAAIATLRSIALAVTAGGLVVAAAGWVATRRAWATVTVVVLITAAGFWGVRQQFVRDRLMDEFRIAAMIHVGHVTTPGYAYWLLDPHFYTRFDARADPLPTFMVPAEAERYVLRAAVSFFAVPLPWKAESWGALALLPQQVAWYGLVALAVAGTVAGWRRDAVFTWVLVGNVLLGASAVALYSGNVGTMVRMRDLVVPVMIWLSALGGCAALDWAARALSREAPHAPA